MRGDGIIHPRILDYAYTGTDVLYRDFHISQQGYSDEQVEASRGQYGKNILSGRASDTVLYRLHRAFINPFSMILFVLAAISLVTDVFLASNFSRNFTTVTIILSMLLISGVVRFTQELRAKHVADHLTRMIASNVLVLRKCSRICWILCLPYAISMGNRLVILKNFTQTKDMTISFAGRPVLRGISNTGLPDVV